MGQLNRKDILLDTCYHCGSSEQAQEANCCFGQGLLHCSEHYDKCEICGVAYCNLGKDGLVENVDGEHVCQGCTEQPHQEYVEHCH